MADQQLPLVPSVANYRVATTLGEDVFILDVRWNARDAAWYMDLLTDDETPILVGLKLVLGALLGARSTDTRLPAGVLVVCDLAGTGVDAGFDDMGTRVVVLFTPEADL